DGAAIVRRRFHDSPQTATDFTGTGFRSNRPRICGQWWCAGADPADFTFCRRGATDWVGYSLAVVCDERGGWPLHASLFLAVRPRAPGVELPEAEGNDFSAGPRNCKRPIVK